MTTIVDDDDGRRSTGPRGPQDRHRRGRSWPMSFSVNGGASRTPLREFKVDEMSEICARYVAVVKSPTPAAAATATKSPMNPLSCSSSSYIHHHHHATTAAFSASASVQTSIELLQAKVSHLEKERVDLSMQLHQQSEKERSKKIQMEKMEATLKSNEREKELLTQALADAQGAAKALKDEKEQMLAEAKKLNEQIEAQNTAASETRNLWTKMTAASRELKRLEDDIEQLRNEKADMAQEKDQLVTTVEALREASEKQQEEMTLLRLEVEGQRRTAAEAKKAFEAEAVELRAACASLHTMLDEERAAREADAEAADREKAALEAEIEGLKEQVAAGGRPSKQRIANGDDADGDADEEEDLEALGLQEALQLVEQLKKKLLACELKRKQLHNTLQELRGNIRVFVRCRPFLRGDGDEYESGAASASGDPDQGGCVKFHKDGSSVSLTGAAASARGAQVFAFDQVFKCGSSQEEVYKEVSDLVQSALDGYKVCIFSYGQTGSGKTHTMSGGRDGPARGLIPRAVEQIVEQVLRMRADGWEVTVTASMLEIYNEELRDLLGQDGKGAATATAGAAAAAKDKEKLKVSNLQGFVTVAGLTAVELDTRDLRAGTRHLEQLLDRANKARMTACTAMNERSSRSHALFMLDIAARHADGTTFLRGGLRLVDLAGSERLDRTGTATDAARLKETVNINKSLSCLADVFLALANKQQHVPYRNSKLTLVLQDCLSGDGKALMFVNVSPTHASSQETLCSLRFASQVSQVELGKASKNVFNVMPPQMQPPPPALLANGPAAAAAAAAVPAGAGIEASARAARGARGAVAGGGAVRAVRAAPAVAMAPAPVPSQHVPNDDDEADTSAHNAVASTAAIRGSSRAAAKRPAAAALSSVAAPVAEALPPPPKRTRQSVLAITAPVPSLWR